MQPLPRGQLAEPLPEQPRPGELAVRASGRADREPGRLGLGPAPSQRPRLQSKEWSHCGGIYKTKLENQNNCLIVAKVCLANPSMINTAKCSLPLDVCLANPQFLSSLGCSGNVLPALPLSTCLQFPELLPRPACAGHSHSSSTPARTQAVLTLCPNLAYWTTAVLVPAYLLFIYQWNRLKNVHNFGQHIVGP